MCNLSKYLNQSKLARKNKIHVAKFKMVSQGFDDNEICGQELLKHFHAKNANKSNQCSGRMISTESILHLLLTPAALPRHKWMVRLHQSDGPSLPAFIYFYLIFYFWIGP